MERPEQVDTAWDRALAADRPFVLDFVTDPAVPPIPPHATWDQIQAASVAALRGDSDREAVLRQGIKAKAQDFLTRTRDRGDCPGATGRDQT